MAAARARAGGRKHVRGAGTRGAGDLEPTTLIHKNLDMALQEGEIPL